MYRGTNRIHTVNGYKMTNAIYTLSETDRSKLTELIINESLDSCTRLVTTEKGNQAVMQVSVVDNEIDIQYEEVASYLENEWLDLEDLESL